MRHLLLLLLAAPASAQICPGFTAEPLLECLRASYTPSTVYSYDRARDTLFAYVDDGDRTRITDIYVGRVLPIRPGQDPTREGCNGDKDGSTSTCSGSRTINTEHLWPQSMGAQSGRPEADMHHLYPSRGDVNSARGNNPFAEFPYRSATRLYRDTLTFSPSAVGADSLTYSATRSGAFMPRGQVRGDVARALFYFRTIYAAEATATGERRAFFDGMLPTLLAWHAADAPDSAEVARSARVAIYQGTDNPFALDTTLARRAFAPEAVGVAPEPAVASFRVYPSPASTTITVEAPGESEIFDVLGRRVWAGEPTTLDVSAWPAGVYFLRWRQHAQAFVVR